MQTITTKTCHDHDELIPHILPTRSEMGARAACDVLKKIKELLASQDELSMIFAAAPSQNEFLVALIASTDIDWSRITAFHMDEYVGLPRSAPQGFGNFLKERLFSKLPFKSVHYLDGLAPDPSEECLRYTELLKAHPVDIVCLGIGENGHIAFNDPHVALFDDPQAVKVVDLDDLCRIQQVNDGCFNSLDEVPRYALTLTIPTLTSASFMYCIVPGPTKTHAVLATLENPISESCPASILRRHPHAFLYLDKESAALSSFSQNAQKSSFS